MTPQPIPQPEYYAPNVPTEVSGYLKTILDSAPVEQNTKADSWDAFHATQSPEEFTDHFDALPLPQSVKADLFDLKFAPEQVSEEEPPEQPENEEETLPGYPHPMLVPTATYRPPPRLAPKPAHPVPGPDYAAMSRQLAANPPGVPRPALPAGLPAPPDRSGWFPASPVPRNTWKQESFPPCSVCNQQGILPHS